MATAAAWRRCVGCGRHVQLALSALRSHTPRRNLLRFLSSAATASTSAPVPRAPLSSPPPPPAPVRVRYAPSPTGSLHLGGLRTALYNYLLAKQQQQQRQQTAVAESDSSFILRIEDTDQKRLVPGAVEQLISSLSWAGLDFDEGPGKDGGHGPYIQSERLPTYRKHALQLVESGHAYPCFCTPERLAELREYQTQRGQPSTYDRLCASHTQPSLLPRIADADASSTPYTIRLRVPQHGTTTVRDSVRGNVRFDNRGLDDGVLLKSDGWPTYHLAVVVDDHAMRVSHVVRGEEWMTSAPKHVLLYKALGWKLPVFAHLPLLLKPDGSKLSKRHADASVEYYIEAGYLPEAIVNFVAFLGWNPGTRQEVFTLDELVQHFSLQRIQKGGAVVNPHKLDWFNQQHIRRRIDSQLPQLVSDMRPALVEAHGEAAVRAEYVAAVFRTLREHVQRLPQLVTSSHFFFTAPPLDTLSTDVLASHSLQPASAAALLGALQRTLAASSSFEAAVLAVELRELCKREGVEQRQLFGLLRHVLTREAHGPSVAEIVGTMGRERVTQRLDEARVALAGMEEGGTTSEPQQQRVGQR